MGRRRRRQRTHPGRDYRQLDDLRLTQEMTTLVDAGKYRQSLEVAKEIRRRDLLDAHRSLIEKAYRLRASELAEKNLYRESVVMVENAFACGITSLPLADLALRCALAAGEIDSARRAIQKTRLEETDEASLLADLAILAPPSTSAHQVSSCPEGMPPFDLAEPLATDAGRVLRAFALYEKGHDEEARSELAGIGRRSPLARWRLLLRGLMASARGDVDEARDCWARVPSFGPCGSLASGLLERLGRPGSTSVPEGSTECGEAPGALSRPPPGGSTEGAGLTGMAASFEDPRAALLVPLRSLAAKEDADEDLLVRAVERVLRLWPGGLPPAGRARLLRCILEKTALSPHAFKKLAALLGRLPEDPFGFRQAALAAEKDSGEEAHGLWLLYLDGFAGVEGIPGDERRLAEALIWERCGDLARRCAEIGAGCPCAACRRARERLTDVVKPGAGVCYRKSIELDPDGLSSRKKLLSLLLAQKKKKEGDHVAQEIAERWPDDVETVLLLGDSAHARKAYGKAQRYFKLAQALEPLNAGVIARLADSSVASACRHARRGRFDLARADFQKAESLMNGALAPKHQVVWAAMESAAGSGARAEALLGSAIASGLWEVEAWWRMVAAFHELETAPGILAPALARLQELLGNLKHEPAEAERAAAFHAGVKAESLNWPGAAAFRSIVRKYLKRARKVHLSEAKRIEVCHLFHSMGDFELAAAYALAGRKAHPASYQFPLLEALARLEEGAATIDRKLREALSRAGAGAREAGDDEAWRKIEAILKFHESLEGGLPALAQKLFSFMGGGEGEGEEEEGDDGDDAF